MKKPSLSRFSRYKQGFFKPKNPKKYIGDPTGIIYRSSYERQFLIWCDITQAVVKYNSEEVIVPYVSPIDNKVHRYFIDFFVIIKQQTGELKKYLVEIKPLSETRPPRQTKNMLTESFYKKVRTFAVNNAKWKAADEFARANGAEFLILTEKELFPKGKK